MIASTTPTPSSKKPLNVAVRCRPLSQSEKSSGSAVGVSFSLNTNEIFLKNPRSDPNEPLKSFTFDKIYAFDSSQAQVYENTAFPIIQGVIEGYNGTIFCYGQTGAGKTYTLEGALEVDDHKGIIPRAFNHIFDYIRNSSGKQFIVRVSMFDIYYERIRDLLSSDRGGDLQIRENPEIGVYIKGLKELITLNAVTMLEAFNSGKTKKLIEATNMGQCSSRSNCIFRVVIEASEIGQDGQQHITVGKLTIADLSGSERVSKVPGDRSESARISLSISSLGHVILALADAKSKHIPYRDSKITRILQESLGGNAKTVMIANISPADSKLDETLSTLRLANRAKFIMNEPIVNEDPKQSMLREFREEIMALKKQVGDGDIGIVVEQRISQLESWIVQGQSKERLKYNEEKVEAKGNSQEGKGDKGKKEDSKEEEKESAQEEPKLQQNQLLLKMEFKETETKSRE